MIPPMTKDNNKADHPLTAIFPLIEGDAFQELVADIKAHGLCEAIWLYEDQILDGRNRYRACEAAGIEPRFTTYDGDNPLAFVISLNLKRRHLTAPQLAFVALDIERVEAEFAKERMLAGKKDPKQNVAGGHARDKAANLVGVNRQYISDAKKISKADNGVANLVRDGTIKLHEAKTLIALPHDSRGAAVKALANGATLKEAVRNPVPPKSTEKRRLPYVTIKVHGHFDKTGTHNGILTVETLKEIHNALVNSMEPFSEYVLIETSLNDLIEGHRKRQEREKNSAEKKESRRSVQKSFRSLG